jgi:hypothetical protein
LVDINAALEEAQNGAADLIHGVPVVLDGLAAH